MTNISSTPKYTFISDFSDLPDTDVSETDVSYTPIPKVEITVHACYQMFSNEAWDEINQSAIEQGLPTLSSSDVDTIVSMSYEVYDASSFTGKNASIKLDRYIRCFASIYAEKQGITDEQAISTFVTCGIFTIIEHNLSFHQAINMSGDITTIDDIPKLQERMKGLTSIKNKTEIL